MRLKNKRVILLILLTSIFIVAIRIIANYPLFENIKTKFTSQKAAKEKETSSTLEIDEEPFPTVPEITPLFNPENIPQGDTFTISGVTVPNFYKNADYINDIIGEVMVVDHPTYKVFYYPLDEGFIISIVSSPFEKVREKAEEGFLKALAIDKDEACMLKVDITTSLAVNPQQAAAPQKLSWCDD